MSGIHSDLLLKSVKHVQGNLKVAFGKDADFVLKNPFIELSSDDLEAYKVEVGSGMGVECSGDVSDVVFFELAERNFALKPDVRTKYYVQFYARFRDDIIVILGGDYESRVEFCREFKQRCSYFEVKFESINRNSAVMLDLKLEKGKRFARTGVLDISMHTKDTAQGMPLSFLSAHLPSIHVNWPISRCIHFQRCCSDVRSFRAAVHSLFVKIVSADPCHPALGLLCESYLAGKAVRSSGGNGKRRGLNSRLILPYHPSLSRVNSLLQDVTADFDSLGFPHLAPWVTW